MSMVTVLAKTMVDMMEKQLVNHAPDIQKVILNELTTIASMFMNYVGEKLKSIEGKEDENG